MKDFFKNTAKYYKYVVYSVKAELKSEVAESYLSWLWWILDPLLFMLVYTFVAVIVFGRGEQYFSAFVFIGYTSYRFFERMLKQSVRLVQRNKSIVSRVYMPKYVLLYTEMGVDIFKMLISYALVIIAMALYRVPLTWNVLYFIPLLILLILVTFGFSAILMNFGVYVQDLENIITVALRLVFYMSGIFYSISKRLNAYPFWGKVLLKGNPMAFIIDQMRNALLYGKGMDWRFYGIWVLLSLFFIWIGLTLIRKNENSYVKVI